jgi:hypothetical protein
VAVKTLDRRVPKDWTHVSRYPLRGVTSRLGMPLSVEKILDIPRQYGDEYDQGTEGACVGYSQSWMMSILNRRLYDAFRLYASAQGIDDWDDTPPAGGTSLRAGFDVLRTIGHWRIYAGKTRAPMLDEGIVENRWTSNVDDVRAAIASDLPVNIGINWYESFFTAGLLEKARYRDKPNSKRREYWLGVGTAWGWLAGGHAITIVGASDGREAFALCNTWGASYPFIVWLPYAAFERLIREEGEAGIVTDRVKL